MYYIINYNIGKILSFTNLPHYSNYEIHAPSKNVKEQETNHVDA